jgi:hypothetical protein
MTETRFTHPEMEKLARLVNNFGILGSQLICRSSQLMCRILGSQLICHSQPDLGQLAHANLQNLKISDEQLLRRVNQLARKSGDEGALRLIEDLERLPSADPMQSLSLARRCLLASAFLGHCIAAASRHPYVPSVIVFEQHRTLN